ncbi:MAG: glycosyltransferase family 2 protein [Candidatus Riflebacteria bacterium]|nr:glycosyltransferase family 2 protein [Candidatus Riflebacteria bacterium]
MPKVSVVIPNYNHARFLARRIESILQQSFQDLEIIILDDDSNDGSREIISDYKKKCPQIRTYFNDQNSKSAFKQWDLGVQKSLGEYLWIAESDDYAEKEFLADTVSVLEKNPGVGIVYCESKIVDEFDNILSEVSHQKPFLSPHWDKWKKNYINQGKKELASCLYLNNTINNASSVLFRKNIYLEAGQADQSMIFCGDWYLYIRMLMISDVAYIARVHNNLRVHSGSTRFRYFDNEIYFKELMRIYAFLGKTMKLDNKQRKEMSGLFSGLLLRKLFRRFSISRKLYREIKRFDPYFEFHAIDYFAKKIWDRGKERLERVVA